MRTKRITRKTKRIHPLASPGVLNEPDQVTSLNPRHYLGNWKAYFFFHIVTGFASDRFLSNIMIYWLIVKVLHSCLVGFTFEISNCSLETCRSSKVTQLQWLIVAYRILGYTKPVEHFKPQIVAVKKKTVSHKFSQISFTIYLEIFIVDLSSP